MWVAGVGAAAKEIFQAARMLRAGLLVSLLGAGALSLPPQVREIYGVLAEDRMRRLFQIFCLFWFLVLFVIAQRKIASVVFSSEATAGRRYPAILDATTVLTAGLVPLGIAGGMLLAANETQLDGVSKETLQQIPELIVYQSAIATSKVWLYFGSVMCLLVAVGGLLGSLPNGRFASLFFPGWDIFSRKTRLAFAVLAAATILLYTSIPLETANVIGTLGVILWFLVCLTFVCSLTTRLSDRYGIPIVSLIILAAVIISAFNLNDNHAVRPSARPLVKLPRAEQAFRDWYSARPDKESFRGRPYPVFLVAAAGGGLYAAQHTAKVLSRLQDHCPSFAQHTFLVSGVSGGSVGAAVFGALAKRNAVSMRTAECRIEMNDKGGFEKAAEVLLDYDFLGSLVGAALFPDFLQRFLPIKVEFFDRGRTLDQALERAWARVVKENGPLSAPYLDYWNASSVFPALLLNTTSVERGHRVVATPFRIAALGSAFTGLTGLSELHHVFLDLPAGATDAALEVADINRDVKLSTAVGMTARFPWISPAASIRLERSTVRLVDGGIYENSAMETVRDVLNSLKQFESPVDPKIDSERPFVKFYLISIDGIEDFEKTAWSGLGELLSPIRAMLAARSQRGYLALYRAITERSPDCILPDSDSSKCDPSLWKLFFLNHTDFNLPLGWHLSSATQSIIDLHSGFPGRDWGRGLAFESRNKDERLRGFIELNNDSACQVIRVFDGRGGELCSRR